MSFCQCVFVCVCVCVYACTCLDIEKGRKMNRQTLADYFVSMYLQLNSRPLIVFELIAVYRRSAGFHG